MPEPVTETHLLLDRRARRIQRELERLPADRMLDTEAAADLLGVGHGFLERRRVASGRYGQGPQATRIGGQVRYRVDALKAWLHARAIALRLNSMNAVNLRYVATTSSSRWTM